VLLFSGFHHESIFAFDNKFSKTISRSLLLLFIRFFRAISRMSWPLAILGMNRKIADRSSLLARFRFTAPPIDLPAETPILTRDDSFGKMIKTIKGWVNDWPRRLTRS
jgi:hypothetical protein